MNRLFVVIVMSVFLALSLAQKTNAVTYNFNQPQKSGEQDMSAEIEKASETAEKQLDEVEKTVTAIAKKLESILPKIKKLLETLTNTFQKLQKSTEENVIKPVEQAK